MNGVVFEKELNLIKNERYKKFSTFLLKNVPDYFYEIPASSTGKHHPVTNQGKGGLVRHTKLAIYVALDSFILNEFKFNDNEKDLIIMALLFHDTFKCGKNPQAEEITGSKTDFEHPRIAANFVNKCNTVLKNKYLDFALSDDELKFVTDAIQSHMGQWNTKEGHEDLPLPVTKAQRCVHNADYYASRKFYDNLFLDLLRQNGYNIEIDPNTNGVLPNNNTQNNNN